MGLSTRWLNHISGEMKNALRKRIFTLRNQDDFNKTALEIFNYQRDNNPVYRTFTVSLGKGRNNAETLNEITFLPVEFFRNHKIITGDLAKETVFESSGTTGVTTGRHYVCDLSLYEESFMKTFRLFYGDPGEYMIAVLLPSYVERSGSSLVYMADRLIKESRHSLSGFYKGNPLVLLSALDSAKKEKRKILLLGVSFALLDLAEEFSPDLSGVTVMETGGMKGRRKEITRQELHNTLKEKFNVQNIHSEYGMTELLSQAYSPGNGLFYCPPWMKIVIRDPHDPLTIHTEAGRTGGINIIDLANINSCSFIATGDLGRIHEDGGFEVIGRFDNSDIRGCNLLIE
jgi:phenylacetate-coenzyme A ligase PaaK-like adenylate-forming protein